MYEFMQVVVGLLKNIEKNTRPDEIEEKKPTVEGFKPGGNL
jgi:hypothetical protein